MMRWYADMGIDAVVGHAPVDRLNAAGEAASEPRAEAPPVRDIPETAVNSPMTRKRAVSSEAEHAREIAAHCNTLEELRTALGSFEGCPLKKSATQLVFADGTPGSDIMFIGEAPGREEDRQGKPFVGRSGQLLDRMLAGLGLSREETYISNIVPWRPPLNRKPELSEIEVCLPFLLRHIELAAPKVIMTLGGTATNHLLGQSGGIMSLRGRWFEIRAGKLTVPVMPTFHPAYLLRTPAQKRKAWQDFLTVKLWLEEQRN